MEIILTSPLGIVPRDLEYTYPAAHYDIPVTGDWSEIEKQHLENDLLDFFKKIDPSIPLLGYLKGTERDILIKVCDKFARHLTVLEDTSSSLTRRQSQECLRRSF